MWCWVLLALPLQGFAAVTMHLEASTRHGSLAGMAPAASVVVAHPCHAAVSAAVADEQGAPQVPGKCSVCASCSVAGAWLAALPLLPAPALMPTVFATHDPAVPVIASEGPDRPPRSLLA